MKSHRDRMDMPGLRYVGTYTPAAGPFQGLALPLYEMLERKADIRADGTTPAKEAPQ